MSTPITPSEYTSYLPSYLSLPASFTTQLNFLLQTGTSAAFWYGLQTGTCFLFLVLLVLLTRPAKRRSPVFLLNSIALLLSFVRSTCQASYFSSQFWTLDSLAGAYDSNTDVTAVLTSQTIAALCAAAQTTAIMGSLYLQIRAVCAPMSSRSQRLGMLLTTATLAIINIIYIWFAAILDINVCIIGWKEMSCVYLVGWWQLASWLFQGTVALFSCVFVGKLGVAIQQRRRLGIKQFGPMHMVAIGAAQTMVVPGMSEPLSLILRLD